MKKYEFLSTILIVVLEEDKEGDGSPQNVCVEMKTKEFFQFLHQIENIKYCLSNVQNTQ